MLGFLYFLIRFLPRFFRGIWLFIMHGPIKGSIRQVGKALLESLCDIGVIHTPYREMRVIADEEKRGEVFCHVDGGTRRERAIYLDALRELLGPIESPRYILVRKSKLGESYVRYDYHSVPAVLGMKREHAERFSEMWTKHVGEMELVYTRNKEGRITLLRARNHSLAAGFIPQSERVSKWK